MSYILVIVDYSTIHWLIRSPSSTIIEDCQNDMANRSEKCLEMDSIPNKNVKTDKEFQSGGETSRTTATFVIVDGWIVTVASVGDSCCILDTQGGTVATLTVDHRLEENVEKRQRVTTSGGEVGRLSIVGGAEIGPLRCWPGGLCLSRSIRDMDVGEYMVPIPYVKQVNLSNAGWRLIIASDGIWDALPSEMAANSCRALPAELAARQVVKEALRTRGLKDDTTCIVVDIIPPDNSVQPSSPPKKQNKLTALFFRKRSRSSINKTIKEAISCRYSGRIVCGRLSNAC